MADLRSTAVSPHTMRGGQAQAPRGLAATALDPLRRAYQAYQQYVGQPFQQAVRGGVRGYFGLPMMSDADALGREAYRQAEALGYTPGVGMPAGAVRLAAEGVQALPSIAGDIGRVIAGMPSSAGAAQAEDFTRYQRSIPPSDVSPLTAFHGTPHRFEPTPANPLGEFRAAKIGSGEGAQAYGYGLYFAESPGVAKGYQTTLAYKAFDVGPEAEKLGIKLSAGARGEFIRQANGNTDPVKAARGLQNANISARSIPKEKLEELFKGYYERGGGNLYTVDIPDSMVEKMLDWDKPLSQQPEVMKAINNTKWLPATEPNIGNMTGEQLYKNLSERNGSTRIFIGDKQMTSDYLRQQGIPGIRYLDAGSRGGADGTRNIVVFPGEESKVKILKRE